MRRYRYRCYFRWSYRLMERGDRWCLLDIYFWNVDYAVTAGLNIAAGVTAVSGKAHGYTLHKVATNM